MPTTDLWTQFPVVGVIALFLALIGGGVRWAWGELSKERDKDRTWRDDQNQKREAAEEKRDMLWQQTVREMVGHWEEQDRSRDGVMRDILIRIDSIKAQIEKHDERAARIERNTEPRRKDE